MTLTTIFSLALAGLVAQQTPPATPTSPAAPQSPAAQQQPAAPQKPLSGNLKVRIGTSTYLADGRVLNASASDWPLALNTPLVAFATSGKTQCESRAATTERPTEAASGWRVDITPTKETASELTLLVKWRRQWAAPPLPGRVTPLDVATGSSLLTLHPGDRIVVDYLSSATRGYFLRYKLAELGELQKNVAAATAKDRKTFTIDRNGTDFWVTRNPDACNAVGMSLEIGLEPAKANAIVEAELWLVRHKTDGTEQSERQVVRLPIGQPPASYYFDEEHLAALPAKSRGAYAKVLGELSAFSVENGQIHLNFTVSRRYDLKKPDADATSTYRDLVATPGEVLAFQLPTVDVPLSVRLRAQVLR